MQHFSYHQAKHPVTEKFKPLIRMDITRDSTRMHERPGEQLAILEVVEKFCLEYFSVRLNLFCVKSSFGVVLAGH